MTEEEAKTKWCPMVRHMVYPNTFDPSGGNIPHEYSCCIASDCMMWRWDEKGGHYITKGTGTSSEKTVHVGTGHCGLGGK